MKYTHYRVINIVTNDMVNSNFSSILGIACANLHMYDENDVKRSVGGNPLASSSHPKYNKEYAFDDDMETLWHVDWINGGVTTYNYMNQYIGYFSPEPYELFYIKYKPHIDPVNSQEWLSANIECSNDGINWNYYGTINPNKSKGDFSLTNEYISGAYKSLYIRGIDDNLVSIDVYNYDLVRDISFFSKNDFYTIYYLYDTVSREVVDTVYTTNVGERGVFYNKHRNKRYQIFNNNNHLLHDTDYEGRENIKGFVEGKTEPTKVTLTDQYGNELVQQLTTDFEFKNYNIENLNGNIKVNNQLTPINYYTTTPQKKGYITGSVNNSCDGTNFKIRVYREDGFFIGDYVIAENGSYEIPNLNVHSSYDVLLYDLNLAVETQVNSRRIPTAYSVTE